MKKQSYSDDFQKKIELNESDWVKVRPFVDVISGSGGGGKSGSTPTEDRDSFRSNAIARVILAYSVGETEGLLDGAKSIFFDGTALQSPGGEFNFSGVRWEERFGLDDQPPVKGFEQTVIVTPVSAPVTVASGPVVRTVDSVNIDSVRILITFPSLQTVSENGDVRGTSVTLNFAVRDPNTDTWIDRGNEVITGKSSGPFQVAFRLQGPDAPLTPWDWRVTRITADSDSSRLQNETSVEAAVEIRESRNTYPGVAYVAIEVDTSLFGNRIPNVSLNVSGVKVKVPVNYDETNGVPSYSGAWNGTFKFASTSNPAWHVYNMIINQKYGLEIEESFLDKYAFYTIAQYCDAVDPSTGVFVGIPDGKNGVRRRFTFNTQITQDEDALILLQNMASSFRGLIYYGAGAIIPSQDRPKNPSSILTNENVLDGRFLYSSTEAKDRITVANIGYNDKDNFYAPTFTTYPPQEDWDTDPNIARYGRNVYDGAKIGCNNEAEAFTFAKWIVTSSCNETETVQFVVGPEHCILRPGDVIEIYDRRFVKERFGGRIVAATANTVTLDAPVTLNASETYTITVVGSDGITLENHVITNTAGTHTVITTATNFSAAPVVSHTWAIKGSDIAPRLFRVINIEKKSLLEYEVFAMFHDENKYAFVEDNVSLIEQPFRRINILDLQPASNVTFEMNSRLDSTIGVINTLKIRWNRSPSELVSRYRVQYRRDLEDWKDWGITSRQEAELNVTEGEYDFLIYSQNNLGNEGVPVTASYTVEYETGDTFDFGGNTLTIQPPILNNVS